MIKEIILVILCIVGLVLVGKKEKELKKQIYNDDLARKELETDITKSEVQKHFIEQMNQLRAEMPEKFSGGLND